VAGTLCEGETQGAFADKYDDCRQCEFYQLVKAEEMPDYKIATTLLRIMREAKRGEDDPASHARTLAVGNGADRSG
jgi:hypothetical protein